nr:Serine/threonine-protein kinase toxin HipA [Paraburkholderia busanensis]
MTSRTLNIFANGERVGMVADRDDIWSFVYDANWLASQNAFPLSPAFPLQTEAFVDGSSKRPVQWFFDNLLPEERMRTVLARDAKVDEHDAWGLLSHYGRESAGALTLLKDSEIEPAAGLQPLSFQQLEARIKAMPERPLTAAAPKRMSAAGAQPKLLVTMKGAPPACELFEPVGNEASMQLLKPDAMETTGYPHAAVNEFFCMQLAQAAGLTVPRTYFIRVPTACYLIDRFDRDTSVEPPRRIHVIDATQLLNYARTFKYEQVNAEGLQRVIEMTSTRAFSRFEIFRWSIFNVLIGNADAHLKNLSFFVTPYGYQLAPFYDLVSTVVYHDRTYQPENADHWPDCALSMPIGEARYFSDMSRPNMLQFAEALGIRTRGAEQLLDDMLRVVADRTPHTLAKVTEIAKPRAGEVRLLNSIHKMPIAEMSKALAK